MGIGFFTPKNFGRPTIHPQPWKFWKIGCCVTSKSYEQRRVATEWFRISKANRRGDLSIGGVWWHSFLLLLSLVVSVLGGRKECQKNARFQIWRSSCSGASPLSASLVVVCRAPFMCVVLLAHSFTNTFKKHPTKSTPHSNAAAVLYKKRCPEHWKNDHFGILISWTAC